MNKGLLDQLMMVSVDVTEIRTWSGRVLVPCNSILQCGIQKDLESGIQRKHWLERRNPVASNPKVNISAGIVIYVVRAIYSQT